jgi:hypothetical protein
MELSNFGAPEPSVQICGRLLEQLGRLGSSAGDFESTGDGRAAQNPKAFRLIIFVFFIVRRFTTS